MRSLSLGLYVTKATLCRPPCTSSNVRNAQYPPKCVSVSVCPVVWLLSSSGAENACSDDFMTPPAACSSVTQHVGVCLRYAGYLSTYRFWNSHSHSGVGIPLPSNPCAPLAAYRRVVIGWSFPRYAYLVSLGFNNKQVLQRNCKAVTGSFLSQGVKDGGQGVWLEKQDNLAKAVEPLGPHLFCRCGEVVTPFARQPRPQVAARGWVVG